MTDYEMLKATLGVVGSALIWAFGEWTTAMQVLIIFMAIDYFTGLAIALVWKKSPKTESGALNSQVGFKGLIRKMVALCMVLVANLLDRVTGSNFVRDAVIIAYIINEAVSIIENAGIMGVPIPHVILDCIDALKNKEDER